MATTEKQREHEAELAARAEEASGSIDTAAEPADSVADALNRIYSPKRGTRNPNYQYDPRTATGVDKDGNTWGVVTWMPDDSDAKIHLIIKQLPSGEMQFVHDANTHKPATLKQAKDISKLLDAMRLQGRM